MCWRSWWKRVDVQTLKARVWGVKRLHKLHIARQDKRMVQTYVRSVRRVKIKLRNGSVTVRSRRRKLWEKFFQSSVWWRWNSLTLRSCWETDCSCPAKTAEIAAADVKLVLLVRGPKSRISAEKKLQSTKLC